jgi:hypothetical protein
MILVAEALEKRRADGKHLIPQMIPPGIGLLIEGFEIGKSERGYETRRIGRDGRSPPTFPPLQCPNHLINTYQM